MTQADDERAESQARRLMLLIPQLMMGYKGLLVDTPPEVFPAGRPSPRHMAMMLSLAAIGPASVSDLAARMNLTLTHASQIVGELAGSGFVDRREDDNDRRRTIVSVAPSHRDLIEAVATGASHPLMEFCSALPQEEAEQFVTHLTLLVSFLAPAAGRAGKAGAVRMRKGASGSAQPPLDPANYR